MRQHQELLEEQTVRVKEDRDWTLQLLLLNQEQALQLQLSNKLKGSHPGSFHKQIKTSQKRKILKTNPEWSAAPDCFMHIQGDG